MAHLLQLFSQLHRARLDLLLLHAELLCFHLRLLHGQLQLCHRRAELCHLTLERVGQRVALGVLCSLRLSLDLFQPSLERCNLSALLGFLRFLDCICRLLPLKFLHSRTMGTQ